MIRLLHRSTGRLAMLGAVIVALGGTLGCAADATTFIILQNNQPTVEEGEIPGEFVCKLEAALGANAAPDGVLDLEEPQGYTFSPMLRGGLKEDPNSITRRHIMLSGADVFLMAGPSERSQMLIASIGENDLRRTALTSGTIPPGDTLKTTTYPLIDADQARLLSSNPLANEPVQIIARTQVFGSVDGNDVESDFFEYPITLCVDCVFDLEDREFDIDGNPLPDISGRIGTSGCFGDQYP